MVTEEVDRTPLAEHVEGHFDRNLPAETSKSAGHHLHEKCVVGVEQPVECLPVPAQAQISPRAERARDRVDRTQRQLVDMASLDA